MAAPTVQAVGAGAAVGNADLTLSLPGHAADDILIAVIETANEAVTSPTSGWAQTADSPQSHSGTTPTRLTAFWKRATSSSETGPVFQGTTNHKYGATIVIRGCIATGAPWDVTSGGIDSGNNASLSITGDTTTVPDCLILYLAARGNDASGGHYSAEADSSVTSLTERFDDGTTIGNGGGLGLWTGVRAAAGTYGPMTATLAANSPDAFLSLALKPPDGGIAGTIAASQAAQTATFSGAEAMAGTVAASQAEQSGALTGQTANPVTGTLPAGQGDQTGTFAGAETVTGDLAATQEAQVGAFTATESVTGELAAVEADDTAGLAGTVADPVSGTLSAAQEEQTAELDGEVAADGVLATVQADQAAAFSGTAALPVSGQVTGVGPADSGAFPGTVAIFVDGQLLATQDYQLATFSGPGPSAAPVAASSSVGGRGARSQVTARSASSEVERRVESKVR